MKVAARLRKPVQWCQRNMTSTEFIDWLYFFEEEERENLKTHDKQDHYFALLALKVQQVLEVLCDVKVNARKTLEDMFLQFVATGSKDDGEYETVKRPKGGRPQLPRHDPYKPLPRGPDGRLIGGIDTEDDGPLPERWQQVTDRAKLAIGAMIGMPLEELYPDGNGPTT